MIINELRFSDFLVFSREQLLEFPTEAESNVIILLAPNNTGKTNVIRALKFLFYGHLPDCTEATAYRLINERARARARTGTELAGWVEAAFELDGESFRVRRSVKTRKLGKDQWFAPEITFRKVRRDREIRLEPDKDKIMETRMRTAVPEALFDAFYFKGEPLDGKLLGGVRAIRESLQSFLHEDQWEEAERAAEEVRRGYTREIEKLTERHKEYNALLSREEAFRGHALKQQEELKRLKLELEAAAARFDELTTKLQELGPAGDSEKVVQEFRQSRDALEKAKRSRERADGDIRRLVGSSKGIPFLLGAIPTARRLLKEMQEDNILPADISAPFVDRVLKAKQCICGCEHTDETRAAWLKYRERTLSADLNRGLTDLLNAVQEDTPQSYQRFSEQLAAEIEQAIETRGRHLQEAALFETKCKELEQRLAASPVEAIRAVTAELRKASDAKQRLQGEIGRLETDLGLTQKNLANLKPQLEKAKPGGEVARKEKILQKGRTRAEKLRLLIQESRELMTKSFHAILQRSVSEYYDQAVYDGSRARISRASLLPAIETNGEIHGNLGGGQSQLLALAYIVSLSRLRKSLHAQMVGLGIGLGKLDDQSFFLDSPFNQMTEHYAHAIARFLDGNARQVVLLLARQQWNLVKPVLGGRATRMFAFHYATLAEKVRELKEADPKLEDFTYEIGKRKLRLLEELPRGEEHPYTTIDRIE